MFDAVIEDLFEARMEYIARCTMKCNDLVGQVRLNSLCVCVNIPMKIWKRFLSVNLKSVSFSDFKPKRSPANFYQQFWIYSMEISLHYFPQYFLE